MGPVPVWSPLAPSAPIPSPTRRDESTRPAAESTPAAEPTTGTARRPRSAFLFALLAFYLLQLAAAVLAWSEAPIRTESLSDAMRAWAVCVVAVLPALLLRGRWRALPALAATVLGALVPVLLARDLMEVVGPREVWVGQSLTLQVLFPLLIGLTAVIAVLSAPRRGSGSPRGGAQ